LAESKKRRTSENGESERSVSKRRKTSAA
jgi:hypothetical protein